MDAYERVLGDAMEGDATLFAREDYVEEAWRIVDPVLKAGTPVYEYEPSTWGPGSRPGRDASRRLAEPRSPRMAQCMKVEILADADTVAQQAAVFAAPSAGRRRRARTICRGGQRRPHAVADAPGPGRRTGAVGQVHVVQVDERVAPAGDPDRNLTHLRESLLAHAPLSPERLHAMPVESADLDAAAARYARELGEIAGSPPVLDLAHLGSALTGTPPPWCPGIRCSASRIAMSR